MLCKFAGSRFDVLAKHQMTLRIGRTIFAMLVGLSVATLPASLGFAGAAPMAVSASQAMPDCEHHHTAPSDKTQKTADDSACMAACALHCFNFTATGFSGVVFSTTASAALKLVRTRSHVVSQMGNPPFRPPRA
jgi:hypothetical protein